MNDFEILDLYNQVQILAEQIDGLHEVCVLMMETIDMVVVDPEPEEVETVDEAPEEVVEEVVEEEPKTEKKEKKTKKVKK